MNSEVLYNIFVAITDARDPIVLMSHEFYHKFIKRFNDEYQSPHSMGDGKDPRLFDVPVLVKDIPFDWIVTTGYAKSEPK